MPKTLRDHWESHFCGLGSPAELFKFYSKADFPAVIGRLVGVSVFSPVDSDSVS